MTKYELINIFSQFNEEEEKKKEEKNLYVEDRIFGEKRVLWENILKNDQRIAIRKHPRFIHIENHKHNYIELTYVLQGKLRQYILGTTIELLEGEFILLNQGLSHSIEPSQANDLAINIIISPEFLESIFEFICFDHTIHNFLLQAIFFNHRMGGLIFRTCQYKKIQDLFFEIISEFILNDTMAYFKIKLLVALLIVELGRVHHEVEEIKPMTHEKELLRQLLNYIEEHYRTASLTEIATLLRTRDYTLAKLIRNEFNESFVTLLQHRRLEKARELLLHSSLTITEIAHYVGYENWSYFYKIFRKKYQVTPHQLRMHYASHLLSL